MKFERRYINSAEYGFRALENDGKHFIEGYASVFGVRSKLILENRDLFYEEINPGAFQRVLERDGLDVIFTFNHSKDVVLARTVSGTLALSQDDKGLFFRAEIDMNDSDAKNLWLRVKRGDIFENSFAFRVAEEDYRWSRIDGDNIPLRTIDNISDLRDVSAVTYAAYPETSVGARELAEIDKEKEEEEDESQKDKDKEKERDLQILKTRIKIIQLKNNN